MLQLNWKQTKTYVILVYSYMQLNELLYKSSPHGRTEVKLHFACSCTIPQRKIKPSPLAAIK